MHISKILTVIAAIALTTAAIKSCNPIDNSQIGFEPTSHNDSVELQDTDLWLYTDELMIEDSQKVQHNPDTLAAQATHDTKPVW